jgi:hypothetical protein
VISGEAVITAWAPRKKSGNTPVLIPPAARYLRNALPARNRAGRGIAAITSPAAAIIASRGSIRGYPIDNSA